MHNTVQNTVQRRIACNALLIVVRSSKEYDAGRTSLIQQFTSQFDVYNIPCYVTTAPTSSTPVQYRYYDALFSNGQLVAVSDVFVNDNDNEKC